jgi:hypothetical protein
MTQVHLGYLFHIVGQPALTGAAGYGTRADDAEALR